MAEPTAPTPPTPPATPAAPSLPASVSLPSPPTPPAEPAATPPAPEGGEASPPSRDESWANLFQQPATPVEKPAAAAPPAAATEKPPTPATPPTPPAATTPPAPAKPAEPPAAPKPGDKPPEAAKPPETDALPEDILEGISETNPAKQIDQQKRSNKLYQRLRLAGTELTKLKGEIAEIRGKGAVPPDYEEIKTRAARLQTDMEARERELAETRDRLYAQDLAARPEFQERVTKPWNAVQKTVGDICKRYAQNPEDVWSAFGLAKPEERDAVFSEMLTVMNLLDQRRFTDAIEAVPRISAEQARLQVNSKERLDAFRQQDTEKTERARGELITRTVSAFKQHGEKTRAAMPFLFHLEGDSPQSKQYNAGMAEALKLAEQLAGGGADKLSPEMQGMMFHDAVTADYITRNIGSVMQANAQHAKDQQARIEELELANKTLQSTVDEYNGAVPSGGGAPAGGAGNGAVVASDAPLGARIAQQAGSFGWT